VVLFVLHLHHGQGAHGYLSSVVEGTLQKTAHTVCVIPSFGSFRGRSWSG
jgi:hypothetical protein